jgi:UDP-N-acetylglucosamine--N-acetylmuramyl-(pentapeptide) pyrophosphoryl-undecaprenol N-acetylglucosamine transferase
VRRVVITTGGTGGHIFPALAVTDEIRARYPETEVMFIGSRNGREERMAESAGLRFVGLPAKGILGRGIKSLGAARWMLASLVKCWSVFRSFKPELVVGFGSYAGFIPVLLAYWKEIPTAVHVQNIQPGMTNRVLGKRVRKVFISYSEAERFFDPNKTVLTGNPVRRSLIELRRTGRELRNSGRGRVLVFGGSQGAVAINEAVLRNLSGLLSQSVELMHQTGEEDFERVVRGYRERGGDTSMVRPFIEDIASAYDWADLVICRAGASTVAELAVVGKPSILIPFPYAVQQHQLTNARFLEKAGAAVVVEQSYLEEINLARLVGDLIGVPEKLKEMRSRACELGRPEAAARIVDELEALIGPG